MLGSDVHVPKEFSLHSREWWRDLTLGLLGGSLIWALSDTPFHWETVKTHAFAEVVCVAIPLALLLLSPRRVLTVFLGLVTVPETWVLVPGAPIFAFIKTFQAARRFDRYHAGSFAEGREEKS